jgi:hypothetical protein
LAVRHRTRPRGDTIPKDDLQAQTMITMDFQLEQKHIEELLQGYYRRGGNNQSRTITKRRWRLLNLR